MNPYDVEALACGAAALLLLLACIASLRRERQQLLTRLNRSASVSPASPDASALGVGGQPPDTLALGQPAVAVVGTGTTGSVNAGGRVAAFGLTAADAATGTGANARPAVPAAGAAYVVPPPPPPLVVGSGWLSPPAVASPGGSATMDPLLLSPGAVQVVADSPADPTTAAPYSGAPYSGGAPTSGGAPNGGGSGEALLSPLQPPTRPAAGSNAGANGAARRPPTNTRTPQAGEQAAANKKLQRTFPYWSRRGCVVISALCAVWSVDLSGARDVYAYPGVLACIVVSCFLGVLSLWVYAHALAIMRQLGTPFPVSLRRALVLIPCAYCLTSVPINVAYIELDRLLFAALYELASGVVVLCYAIVVAWVYVRLRMELRRFIVATAAVNPRPLPPPSQQPRPAARSAFDVEAGAASPTHERSPVSPSAGSGGTAFDTAYIERALRTLRSFVIAAEVCALTLAFLFLMDSILRLTQKWEEPALVHDRNNFDVADEMPNFIAFLLLALLVWFSWPVAPPAHTVTAHAHQHAQQQPVTTPGGSAAHAPALGNGAISPRLLSPRNSMRGPAPVVAELAVVRPTISVAATAPPSKGAAPHNGATATATTATTATAAAMANDVVVVPISPMHLQPADALSVAEVSR